MAGMGSLLPTRVDDPRAMVKNPPHHPKAAGRKTTHYENTHIRLYLGLLFLGDAFFPVLFSGSCKAGVTGSRFVAIYIDYNFALVLVPCCRGFGLMFLPFVFWITVLSCWFIGWGCFFLFFSLPFLLHVFLAVVVIMMLFRVKFHKRWNQGISP